jgi:hypothetical protein
MKAHKITREQYEAAYRLGIRKHRGEVTITDALGELAATGLNRNSAADLVYIATHLINGRRFTRRLSVPAADDYLRWILRDFKNDGLRRAVTALERHIRYYEKLRNIRLNTDRELVGKYRRLLEKPSVVPERPTLEIEWLDRTSKGWLDLLPLEWFRNEGTVKNLAHEVQELDGGHPAKACCDVSVSGTVVELDYESHADFNTSEGMSLGVARLHFADSDRTCLQSLEWRAKGKLEFKSYRYRSAKLQIPDEGEYQLPTDESPRKPVMLRERPGQATFRKKLKGAYGHTCCMTDCEVPDALEGAHIDRFRSKASDNLRNGLLLRRDAHALFDRHLIAINPDTHVIHVADSIRTSTGYAFLHGKPLRLPKNPTHHPSQSALKRRWALFRVATK